MMMIAPTRRARARARELRLPAKIILKILELLVIECDPLKRLFWCICGDGGDQPHLADLLTRDYCEYHHPEGEPGSQSWVKRSRQMLCAQFAVYAVNRGNRLRNLLLVHRSVREVVNLHYTFLEPIQKKDCAISSPFGYWINPEHDVVMPASIDHPIDVNPPHPLLASSYLSHVGRLHLRELITPSAASLFPWSRVRYLHLPDVSLFSTKYQEVIHYLPNLELICIRYSARYNAPRCLGGVNPHTTTMKSLRQVEKYIMFAGQGSLGLEPPLSGEQISQEDDREEMSDALDWCGIQDIGIIEVDNTCCDCRQYKRFDYAVAATTSRMKESMRVNPARNGRRNPHRRGQRPNKVKLEPGF